MALQTNASFTTPYGTTVDSVYWRWVTIHPDILTNRFTVMAYGYVDKAACDAKAQPIARKTYTADGDDFAGIAASLEPALSTAIYAFLKAKDADLAQAVDVE